VHPAVPSALPSALPSSDPPSAASSRASAASLARLGWDDAWARALAALPDAGSDVGPAAGPDVPRPAAGRAVGRVCRSDAGACDVLVPGPAGPVAAAVPWAPAVRRAARADPTAGPVAGDWVVLDAAPAVAGVLPRRTAVVRAQPDRSSHGQVLAANADVVAVVEPLSDPDLGRLERLLTLAWSSGARPVCVLTKADLVPDAEVRAADLAAAAPGVDVLVVAAPEDVGLAPLRDVLAGGATLALLGASGVGKSTLLNALVGAERMRTTAVRDDGKGRHTTVTRELHLAPGGGAVLDTPGLRTIGLAGAGAADAALEDAFADVAERAAACRFRDCAHRTEPGCAVLAAVESGDLPARRLASYRKLAREARHEAARTDARLRAEMAQVWKQRARAYRRRPDKKR